MRLIARSGLALMFAGVLAYLFRGYRSREEIRLEEAASFVRQLSSAAHIRRFETFLDLPGTKRPADGVESLLCAQSTHEWVTEEEVGPVEYSSYPLKSDEVSIIAGSAEPRALFRRPENRAKALLAVYPDDVRRKIRVVG